MANILIVDDNVDLALSMAGYLGTKDHEVEVVHTGQEGHHLLNSKEFDLLILDWELPDTTGPEICAIYRSLGGQAAVLMLTGRKANEDKVMGLEAGADDYLTKPFHIPEFNARVTALLRRASMSKTRATVQVFDESMIGKTFAGYKIDSVLGTGGMGIVYKATHATLKRTAALKVLSGNYQGAGAKKRFEREAKAMSLLDHPTLVKIFDYGIADHVPYIAMEYVEGNSLFEVLHLCGPLPVKSGLQLFIEICKGLEHAHTQAVIHRDLKPSNIMILVGGEKGKVLDLGLAKFTEPGDDPDLTLAGEVFGSPYYMSPEQGTNSPIDERSDVYSLACVMYEAFCRERPFQGNSFVEITNAKLRTKAISLCERMKPEYFPPALDQAIRQALEPEPADRQESMAEFREQLQKVLQSSSMEQTRQPKLLTYLRNLLGR